MKLKQIVATIALTLLGLVAPAFAQDKPAAPAVKLTPAEYNLAFCGSRGYTVMHTVIATDDKGVTTVSMVAHMADPTTIVKDKQPMVFTVEKVGFSEAQNVTYFKATAKLEDHVLEFDGIIRKDRLVAIQKADGNLSHVFFGMEEKLEDMPSDVQAAQVGCEAISQLDESDIPKALASFLKDDKTDNNQNTINAPAIPPTSTN